MKIPKKGGFSNFDVENDSQEDTTLQQKTFPVLRVKKPYTYLIIGSILVLIISIILNIRYRQVIYANMQQQLYDEQNEFVRNFIASQKGHSTDRPLIIFAYSESDYSRANTLFFIRHGLHAEADFIFILNGESSIEQAIPNNMSNIRVIKRENTCFDLGAMGIVLKSDNNALVKKYKKFILMNSSIRGPFVPTWGKGCWSDFFLSKVTEKVKLVGIAVNCKPAKHIQSMIIATDSIGLDILLKGDKANQREFVNEWGFNEYSLVGMSDCAKNYADAVSAEISLTNLILKANYSIEVLMTAATRRGYYEDCENDSVLHVDKYFGTSLHPYETVFTKVSRNEYDKILISRLTEWHDAWGYTSWEACMPIKEK